MADIDFQALAAKFPPEAIHWRAQHLTRNGDKALALAYLDARDVQDRLDEVCGPANWQDRYEFHDKRTVCYLSIRIGDEWITKADGAGDTAVEGEKGSISDALKRAAVKWGVGRYLYDLGNTWVPCESFEKNGKKHFSKFVDDPWNHVRNSSDFVPGNGNKAPQQAREKPARSNGNGKTYKTSGGFERERGERLTDGHDIQSAMDALMENMESKSFVKELDDWAKTQTVVVQSLPDPAYDEFKNAFLDRRAALRAEVLAA